MKIWRREEIKLHCCTFQKSIPTRQSGGSREVCNRFGKFTCENCSKEFNSTMSLLYHQLENKHLGLLCVVCDKQFDHRCNLYHHVRSMHLQEQFVCVQWPDKRIFTRKDTCRNHQLSSRFCSVWHLWWRIYQLKVA